MASIDAQLRQLAPSKVSEDDKLIEYDALLLDRFLDILQNLHGEDLKETVSFFCLSYFDVFVVRFWFDLVTHCLVSRVPLCCESLILVW